MKKADLDEAVATMASVLDALLLTLQGKTGLTGAKTRQMCGALAANCEDRLNTGLAGAVLIDLAACFEASQQAGATYFRMNGVRVAIEALTPTTPAGIAIKNFAIRMSLAETARILAATNFKSRQDIDQVFDEINDAFEAAELIAADNLDNVAYRLLISIHSAVSNDLANRARPLPRMISYTFATPLPALAMAQRLYADPARFSELIDENKPIHPLFMPVTGKALSD